MSTKVEQEQEARAEYLRGLDVNGTTNEEVDNEGADVRQEISEDFEEEFDPGTYKVVVITALGGYFIFKLYKNNKPFTTYKAKDVDDLAEAFSEATSFFDLMIELYGE